MSNKERKGFVAEFKTFILRGNIVDMAVGVIVGGAFTAVVNGLSNFVLKPIINYVLSLILGASSLEDVYTFLGKPVMKDVLDATGAPVVDATTGQAIQEIDLANSIYIDWGSFINAIINFLLVAFTLFVIIKIINSVREKTEKLKTMMKKAEQEEDEAQQ